MASSDKSKRPPALTVAGRENELISKAYRLAEKQIEAGTASSQVITHFLKLGTVREELDRERVRNENILLEARAAQIHDVERLEKLYTDAMNMMRKYKGVEDVIDDV